MADKTNHPPRGGLVEHICAWCGKPFTCYASDRLGKEPACCQSHGALLRENRLGHGSVTLPCGWCGEPVTRPLSRVSDQVFCNRSHFMCYRGMNRNQSHEPESEP